MDSTTDIIELIKEKDTFAKKLGIEILEARDGCSRVTMPLGEGTANALGIVHGGAMFALADLAFAAASNSEGDIRVAIEVTIHYMRSYPSKGRLEARAEKIHETRRLGFYNLEVFTPDGEIIAACKAIAYRKG